MSTAAPVRLGIVVPVHQSRATLARCVDALVASAADGDRIVLADDGSTDGAIERLPADVRARVHVVRSERNIGRGPIRNLGADAAGDIDVIVFVDSDVVVHADALDRIRTACAPGGSTALIGTYDDGPPGSARAGGGVVSRYRNLLHHHTHMTSGPTATHFWTGLGAVRADVFRALGGLDDGRWARDMEDVEFGHRLVDAGHRIDVVTTIRGTHLKVFTVGSMVRTDLCNRAIPWSTLLLDEPARHRSPSGLATDPFVISRRRRWSAVSSVVVLASVSGLGSRRLRRSAAWVCSAGLATVVVCDRRLWPVLWRRGGPLTALAGVPLHLLHGATSVVGFAVALARHRGRRR